MSPVILPAKRKIRLGSQNPRYYEVLDGLNPGDKVIISDYENFGDADKLILKKLTRITLNTDLL